MDACEVFDITVIFLRSWRSFKFLQNCHRRTERHFCISMTPENKGHLPSLNYWGGWATMWGLSSPPPGSWWKPVSDLRRVASEKKNPKCTKTLAVSRYTLLQTYRDADDSPGEKRGRPASFLSNHPSWTKPSSLSKVPQLVIQSWSVHFFKVFSLIAQVWAQSSLHRTKLDLMRNRCPATAESRGGKKKGNKKTSGLKHLRVTALAHCGIYEDIFPDLV